MIDKNENIKLALKKYFGFNCFKKNQKKIITKLLKKNNVFVIMPTGSGKSLCYQLPALISKGTAIVISPLIALMKNQVDKIREICLNYKIAHLLNSSLNKSEIKKVIDDLINKKTKILYLAPETLNKKEYINILKSIKISFFAIDEAHCISEWGHDFRPEYRNIKKTINKITSKSYIIALTATATPKVQEDIIKNLGIENAKIYKSSFNRPNLYYEVRPKIEVEKQIIKYIKEHPNQSGIIYCLSRKKVEEFSKLLKINNIKALPYHAGLENKLRCKHQDMFLIQKIDVIVATVAFGMGIDKPDVRYVIHYDLSKSLESYYQETGRAGRDGGIGECIAFYHHKDMEKLEKFISNKNVSEREISMQLLNEVIAYAETGMSRRKYLLHYFGEFFDEKNGPGANMEYNMRNPKKKKQAKKELKQLLNIIKKTNQKLKDKELINFFLEKKTLDNKFKNLDKKKINFNNKKSKTFWMGLIRQAIVNQFLKKNIENYGILKITKKGKEFMKKPYSFKIYKDHDYAKIINNKKYITNDNDNDNIDKKLLKKIKKLRNEISEKFKIPPFAILQKKSLNEIAKKYPTKKKELIKIFGIGEKIVKKWGDQIINLVKKYVKKKKIIIPNNITIKKILKKPNHKIFIIQSIDKKIDLIDISKIINISMDKLIKEMEKITYQGIKLNIDYYIKNILDEDQITEIFNYFMNSKTDKIKEAIKYFKKKYSEEDIRLTRIKFFNKVSN